MAKIPPMFPNATAITSRFQKVKGRKLTTWWSHMRDCMRYCAPNRETFFEYVPGQKKLGQVFDYTAIHATDTFAGRLQSVLTPPGSEWASITVGDDTDPEEMYMFKGEELSVEDILSKVTKTVFKYINDSNFYSRDVEANQDAAISMGTLTCEYDAESDELVFDAIPLSSIYVEPDDKGGIGTVWREFKMPVVLLEQKFPGIEITQAMANMAQKSPDTEFQITVGMSEDIKTGDWWQFVVTGSHSEGTTDSVGDTKGELIYSENYGKSNPYIPFRWMVVPGEYYGRGPAMQVLPEILTANKMRQFSLEAGALNVGGLWTGLSDGIFNPYNVRIAPKTIIPVSSNRSDNPSLRPLEVGGNYQLHFEEYKHAVNNILKAFLAEEPFGEITDPTKTATEIRLRRQALLQRTNANFGRLMTEKVKPIIERVIYLLGEEGIIPRLKLDGKEFDIKFTNSIARLQDYEDVEVVEGIIESATALLGPEVVMGSIKVENVLGWMFDKLGADPVLKRSEQEQAQLAEQAAQMAAQQQEQPAA